MNGKQTRSRLWRRKKQRAVSPIIATILLVAITVVLAAVLYILISGLTKGPGNTPIGTSLALGKPAENSKGTNFWYNFSIQSAGGGLVMNNMNFAVLTTSNGVVPPTGWTLNVLGLTGTPVATYSMTLGTWTLGGTLATTTQQTISLDATISLSGNNLAISGAGTFQGSINVAIP
jgi:flagellin-like protein